VAKTSRSTWKARERQAAKDFGARRQRCSGSSGIEGQTRSDSDHPRLFVECKLRAKHAAVTLWDDTHVKATKEGKLPVVVLVEKGRPGRWYLVRHDHLQAVAEEQKAAKSLD
jgi:hypothetical protein